MFEWEAAKIRFSFFSYCGYISQKSMFKAPCIICEAAL